MEVQRLVVDQRIVEAAFANMSDPISCNADIGALNDLLGSLDGVPGLPDGPAVLVMSSEQRALFAADFERPTPDRYPSGVEYRVSQLGKYQLALAMTSGTPFGMPLVRDGAMIHDVFPREDLLERPNSGLGAHKDFSFHTEQAYDGPEVTPDIALFTCIRNVERIGTKLVHAQDILGKLSKEVIEELKTPNFKLYRGRPEEDLGAVQSPILRDGDGDVLIKLGTDVVGLIPDAELALQELKKCLDSLVPEDVILQPGETLVIPNTTTTTTTTTTLHMRSSFIPAKEQANRRWMQRVYVKT